LENQQPSSAIRLLILLEKVQRLSRQGVECKRIRSTKIFIILFFEEKMYKICGICKKSILLNNENFRKDKHQKDGYHWACKKCLSLKEVKRKIQKLSVYDKGLKFQKYYIYYQTKFTKK
jgi:hypothetical protein